MKCVFNLFINYNPQSVLNSKDMRALRTYIFAQPSQSRKPQQSLLCLRNCWLSHYLENSVWHIGDNSFLQPIVWASHSMQLYDPYKTFLHSSLLVTKKNNSPNEKHEFEKNICTIHVYRKCYKVSLYLKSLNISLILVIKRNGEEQILEV